MHGNVGKAYITILRFTLDLRFAFEYGSITKSNERSLSKILSNSFQWFAVTEIIDTDKNLRVAVNKLL
jgi:hypothetical protein